MSISPLELIRQGIETANWAAVSAGYEGMTGQQVEPRDNAAIRTLQDISKLVQLYFSRDPNPKWEFRKNDEPQISVRPTLEYGDDLADLVVAKFESSPELRELIGLPEDPEDDEQESIRGQAANTIIIDERQELDEEQAAAVEEVKKSQFHIEHKGPQGGDGEKRACRVADIVPGMKNKFKDDGKLVGADEESQKLIAKLRPSERRPKVRLMSVECNKCGKKEKVPPILGPKKVEGQESKYHCNDCINKRRRRRD